MSVNYNKPFSKDFLRVKRYLNQLQNDIRQELESVGGPFGETRWKYKGRGGGKSLLIEPKADSFSSEMWPEIQSKKRGKIIKSFHTFEKAGVNVSGVGGVLPQSLTEILRTKAGHFSACGISLVIHPYSPMIPTVHMNVRYFEMNDGDFWFGGGVDLTPYYPIQEDFTHFHRTVFQAVSRVYPERYREFKEKCDNYFTLPHRKEMRGIGGVFFDYLKNNYSRDYDLIRSLGDSFLDCYLPLVRRNIGRKFGRREKEFQLYRRGRYVEFNLLHDRGTLFGLKTGGRVESVLMSLPPIARFPGTQSFPADGFESEMQEYYQPKDWVK